MLLFPKTAIKKDYSVGLAQIKISTAKTVLEESPMIFIKRLTDPIVSLEICGKLLRKLVEEFNQSEISDIDIYEFIACSYLQLNREFIYRDTLLYSAVLKSFCNDDSIAYT